jgi:hypothetical protein
MVVAQIALNRLSPRARAECERLLAIDARPESATFVTASCWADDLKGLGVHAYDTWHYIDMPISSDGTKTPAGPDRENVEWAIGQCLQTLRSPRVPDMEKARMLRFLIHFVGDVHQPLHCVSRYTADHPTGDQGGNLFPLDAGRVHNLHAYWDSGACLFVDVPRPLTPAGQAEIDNLVRDATLAVRGMALPATKDLNVADWVAEGSALAQKSVYAIQPGSAPSPAYESACRALCQRQVVVAGVRLAYLLDNLFGAPATDTRH